MRANRHWLVCVLAAVCAEPLRMSTAVLLTSATVFGPGANVGKPPACVKGYSYFRDFMKCDASLSYCFHYDNQSCIGPANWACADPMNRRTKSVVGERKKLFFKRAGLGNSRCCGGKYQSPIDIPTTEAQCYSGQPAPRYLNGRQAVVGTLENHGLSLEFKVLTGDYDKPVVLTDVPFSCAVPGSSHYVFSSLQIHTGPAERPGSEHLLQGIRYDAEIHLVHIRRDFWTPSVQADDVNPKQPSKLEMRCASQTPLGITIIAILLSVTTGEPNKELDSLLRSRNLATIQQSDKSCPFSQLCDFPSQTIDDAGGQNVIVVDDDMCSQFGDSENEEDDGVRAIFVKGPSIGDYRVGGNENYAIFSARSGNGRSMREDLPHLLNILSSKPTSSFERRGRRQGGRKKRSRVSGRCFCRRRRYQELFLYYAKRGEEFQCRSMHQSDAPFLRDDGRPRGSGRDEPCNQFDNKPLPCNRANRRLKLKPGFLLPSNTGHYQYFGSLTTPPCSEVVNWIVMRQPLMITMEQLTAIRNMESRNYGVGMGTHGNARPPLPVNGRAITTNIC